MIIHLRSHYAQNEEEEDYCTGLSGSTQFLINIPYNARQRATRVKILLDLN